MSDQAAWAAARRFLCVRLDGMGDLLMTTPALRALRHQRDGAHITLLGSAAGAALAPWIPEVDDVLVSAVPWMKGGAPDVAGHQVLVDQVRAGAFDAAIVFTVYSQNPLPAALCLWQAGIPLRLAHCRENPYHLLTDWLPEPEPELRIRHEVRRQLDLVAAIGATAPDERVSFQPSADDCSWADAHLAALGLGEHQRWVALHPGATAESRQYPPELWQEVLVLMKRTLARPVLLLGGDADAPVLDLLQQTAPRLCHRLPVATTPGQLAACLGRASVLLCNNSGPAHLAAAMRTPVVNLYALTNPQHVPWQVPGRVLFQPVPCAFCYSSTCRQGHHQCLRGISAQQVVTALAEVLYERPALQAPVQSPVIDLARAVRPVRPPGLHSATPLPGADSISIARRRNSSCSDCAS